MMNEANLAVAICRSMVRRRLEHRENRRAAAESVFVCLVIVATVILIILPT